MNEPNLCSWGRTEPLLVVPAFMVDALPIWPNPEVNWLRFNGCCIECPLRVTLWFATLNRHQDVCAHYEGCHVMGQVTSRSRFAVNFERTQIRDDLNMMYWVFLIYWGALLAENYCLTQTPIWEVFFIPRWNFPSFSSYIFMPWMLLASSNIDNCRSHKWNWEFMTSCGKHAKRALLHMISCGSFAVTGFLQAYGWFVVFGIGLLFFLKSRLQPLMDKKRQQWEDARHHKDQGAVVPSWFQS